jgi:hypothetical protein
LEWVCLSECVDGYDDDSENGVVDVVRNDTYDDDEYNDYDYDD